MKLSARAWNRIGLALAAIVIAAVFAGYLAVPLLIGGRLAKRYGGRAAFSGWWIDKTSAGLTGLALHEGPDADSPVWATAGRVETDLSLGGMIKGRLQPGRIALIRPRIIFRLDTDGTPLTRPPLKGDGSPSALPEIEVRDGYVRIAQEGRREMTVGPIRARMLATDGGESLAASTDDPTWGRWSISGRFTPGFASGRIELRSDGEVTASPEKTATIPFVPESVWEHISPSGPMRVDLVVTTGEVPNVVTTGEFLGTTLRLPSLGIVSEATTGRMTIDGRTVRLSGVAGKSLGGTVSADGTLDFAQDPPRFDVRLGLKDVDVARTPASWQLAESGVTGRLTGTVDLRVVLKKEGVDLSGSRGRGVVEQATMSGVSVNSLRLSMKAQGNDLEYTTDTEGGPSTAARVLDALKPKMGQRPGAKARPGGFVLPKALSTHLQFEDVDLVQVVAKARALGIPLPFAITGRLSLDARVTIPLGALREVRAYVFHGRATLKGASIDGVDLGAVSAKLDLEDGVLDLTEFVGQLVDRPAGSASNPPPETSPPTPDAPLPSGGFRGRLHVDIDPPGRLTAHFEARDAPLGEIAAPALPRPSPLSGLATFAFDAEADVAHLDDPSRWSVSGSLDAEKVTYRDTTLDRVSTSLRLKDGRVALPGLAARLGGHPLKASAEAGVKAPFDFRATLDVSDWSLDEVFAFVPTMPRPAPVGGAITMKTVARGTLSPTKLAIQGDGLLSAFRAGPILLGDLPLRWTTDGDVIRLAIVGARPFGGSISAEADIPVRGGGAITGSARFSRFDLALASASAPGLKISGRADGKGEFVVRPGAKGNESPVSGSLSLTAPDLVVRGIPAKGLRAALTTQGNDLHYDAYAEGLDGKIEFSGVVPLVASPPPKDATGSLHAVGFKLGGVWPALGFGPSMSGLDGLAAINANLLAHRDGSDLRARGIAEVRDLKWGTSVPIGGAKGIFTLSPEGWRVEPLTGDIFGGSARGSIVSDRRPDGPSELRFDLEIDHASLKKASAYLPTLSPMIDGEGTFRVAGRMADSLRADGEFEVPTARFHGLPLTEFRAPGELDYAPGGGSGTLRLRRWSARFAGGRLTGDARLGFGVDRSFQADTQLSAIDLESLVRVLSDARRPASGKVSGKVALGGPEPDKPERFRGRIDVDLDDASVVELPLFRELDRFLGASRGGVFEDGDIHAVIANRLITLESATMVGRLVQLHATGTVGFDSQVNLEVLVNTNQIISQTGQALAALIPGLSDASGRRNAARARFAGYLGTRLLKFRVTGTLAAPSVNLDPAIAVTEGAAGFFASVLKLPLEVLR